VRRVNWGEERPDKPRRGRWTQAEISLLRDWYGLRDVRSIARELNRTPASVRKMAEQVFQSATRTGPWTSQEVQKLKKYLGASTDEVLARILSRPPGEIQKQILELGRIQQTGRWSREETRRLKRLYGSRKDEHLAVIFGRNVQAIRRQAENLRLAKDKAFLKKYGTSSTRMPRWTKEELEQLEHLYPTTPNLEIAEKLQRSVKSVVSKAHHMGLKKDRERLQEMGRQNVSLRYRKQEE